MSETRSFRSARASVRQGFVFFRQKRFAFRRTAVLHITGDVKAADAAPPVSMKGNPVAQKVQVLLVDDLDGGEADETVTFALDGKTYEIDLTTANADKLRGLLEPVHEGWPSYRWPCRGAGVERRVPLPVAARTPRRSARGRRRTATRSTTAAAFPRPFARRTRRPTAERACAPAADRWHAVASASTRPYEIEGSPSHRPRREPTASARGLHLAPRLGGPQPHGGARPVVRGLPAAPTRGARRRPHAARRPRSPPDPAGCRPTPASPAARAAPPRCPRPPAAASGARPAPPARAAGPREAAQHREAGFGGHVQRVEPQPR